MKKTPTRLTMAQAIQFVNDLKGIQGVDWCKPNTIHTYTCKGRLHNYGTKNKGLYDPDELTQIFGVKCA